MKETFIAIGIVGAVVLGAMGLCMILEEPECEISHTEIRHMPERSQLTTLTGLPWMGKGVPISETTPARDYQVEVCDKYKEKP